MAWRGPRLERLRREVVRVCFSADPKLWPALNAGALGRLFRFQEQHADEKRPPVTAFPDGAKVATTVFSQSDAIPEHGILAGLTLQQSPEQGNDHGEAWAKEALERTLFTACFSGNLGSPRTVMNVVSRCNDAAVMGMMLGTVANPNLVHPEYSRAAFEMEKQVTRRMAHLFGVVAAAPRNAEAPPNAQNAREDTQPPATEGTGGNSQHHMHHHDFHFCHEDVVNTSSSHRNPAGDWQWSAHWRDSSHRLHLFGEDGKHQHGTNAKPSQRTSSTTSTANTAGSGTTDGRVPPDYDPDDPMSPMGLFVSGGTMANSYGYKMGMRRANVWTAEEGLNRNAAYRFIHSASGHYSNITVLSGLGVDVTHSLLHCETTRHNNIDLNALANHLHNCFSVNIIVPAIMLTMGSTDTFAVDDTNAVADLLDELVERHSLPYRPWLHVDAAVGWPMAFFDRYDFDANPLGIPDDTGVLGSLRMFQQRFSGLRRADSITADFHKWGAVPYPAAYLFVRQRRHLEALGHPPHLFQYFNSRHEGKDNFHLTVECTRAGAAVMAAYAVLETMGMDGYRVQVANALLAAEHFRNLLRRTGRVHVMNSNGPSCCWRVYPADIANPEQEFHYETWGFHAGAAKGSANARKDGHKSRRGVDDEYAARVDRTTAFHAEVFERRQDRGLFTSWTRAAWHSTYDSSRHTFFEFPGEKAVFFNPCTTEEHMNDYIQHLLETIAQVDKEWEAKSAKRAKSADNAKKKESKCTGGKRPAK